MTFTCSLALLFTISALYMALSWPWSVLDWVLI